MENNSHQIRQNRTLNPVKAQHTDTHTHIYIQRKQTFTLAKCNDYLKKSRSYQES